MEQVKVKYTLKYTKCELADERVESDPVLVLYYDRHFERSENDGGIHTLALDEHDLTKEYAGVLSGKAITLMGDSIPETACIGMTCYAKRRNEYENPCYTSAGTCHVRFGDIVQHFKKQPNKPFEAHLPLLMETTRLQGSPVRKGRLLFRVDSLDMGSHVSMVPMNQCILGAPLSQIDAVLENFINRRVANERRLEDTWPGITNVRAPMDISSAGIELTKRCCVPIEGFAMAERVPFNVEYFQNAYERTMIRRNLDPSMSSFASIDRAHQAEIMAEVCCFGAQSFDYISDTVDRSKRTDGRRYDPSLKMPFEDFTRMRVVPAHSQTDDASIKAGISTVAMKNTRVAGEAMAAGDCEDGDGLNEDCFHGLSELGNLDAKKYPQLAVLKEIASHYTYFSTLATVHGAKAEDQTEHIGAHMFGMLIPTHQLRAALMTNNIGAQVLEQLPLPPAHTSAGLPTLFCEGTGRIRPMGPGPTLTVKECVRSAVVEGALDASHPIKNFDPLLAERMIVSKRMQSKGGFKVEIPHTYGVSSSFYLGHLLFVTSRFIDLGYNVGAMICGKIDPETREITRGATFVDILNQHENFALIPQEPIPEAVMNITREAVALQVPPHPFVLDKSKPMTGSEKHPVLERLKKRVNGFGRKGTSPFGSVDIFVREHQFSAASMARMGDELAQLNPVYKLDYELEHITNEMHNYRVRIFMDHERAVEMAKKM